MVRVTLLGTAATMPLPNRALTAAVLECGGHSLLFDCGEGTQAAAHAAHTNLMRLDAVCLTHYHGDHIFGLPGMLQTLACLGRSRPLAIYGPAGLGEAMEPILRLAGPLPYPVRLAGLSQPEELEGWPAGAQLAAVPTRHRVPSQGYCFTLPRAGRFCPEKAEALGLPKPLWKELQQGRAVNACGRVIRPEDVLGPPRRGLRVVFSGDTAPCDGLAAAAQDADLLICDATYADDSRADQARQYGHSTFTQAATLAAQAGVRRLWLAHYSPMIEDPEQWLPAARAICPAAECGYDGKSILLRFEET